MSPSHRCPRSWWQSLDHLWRYQDGMRSHPSPSLRTQSSHSFRRWAFRAGEMVTHPCCCPTVLTHLPYWERKRTEKMKSCPFCQLTSVSATCIGSSLKRGVGLGQKLRYCPWDRWSGGRASDMCRSVLRTCILYFMSFNPSSIQVTHYHGHYSEHSTNFACVCAKLLQSCLILCGPMNCSPPLSMVFSMQE